MLRRVLSGLSCSVVVAGAGCLPPAYVPEDGEEMVTIADVEHWTRNNGADPETSVAVGALATWRLGRDAPLPRAWFDGDCLVTEGNWTDTEFSPPSHGKLTFRGAKDGDHELAYHRNEAGFEAEYDDWDDGTALSLEAAGDSLPAFELGSAVLPALELTTFDLEGAEPDEIKISRAEPLTLEWTPGSGEAFLLILQTRDDPDQSYFHTAWCRFPAESGTGTLPLSVMETLKSQKDILFSDIYFGSVAHETKQVESTTVEWLNWNGRGARVQWE